MAKQPILFVIDDDLQVLRAMCATLENSTALTIACSVPP